MTSAAASLSLDQVSRRAPSVSLMQRGSRLMFGSPSVRRSFGGIKTNFIPTTWVNRRRQKKMAETPVFEIDRRGTKGSERLPRIWVTEPACNGTGGRIFVGAYPSGSDKGGWRANELAEAYLAEGASYFAPEEHALRLDCYRAAEILLLHGVAQGNVNAHCHLGYLYEHDLCQGDYWQGELEGRALHGRQDNLMERAYFHYTYAAFRNHSEATWRLGDLVLQGKGCQVNEQRAFQLYKQSFDQEYDRASEDLAQVGNAALRLARCWELGRGTEQSFKRARVWYRLAACSLGAAFEQGQWFYKRERAEARMGIARMTQEIRGCC